MKFFFLFLFPFYLSAQSTDVLELLRDNTPLEMATLTATQDNHLLIGGSISADNTFVFSPLIAKLTKTGSIVWAHSLSTPGAILSIQEAEDQTIGILYTLTDENVFTEIHFAAISATGDWLWGLKIQDYENHIPLPNLDVSSTFFYIRHYASNGNNFISKISTLGVQQWKQNIGSQGIINIATLTASYDGGCVLGQNVPTSDTDSYVTKLNQDGVIEWSKIFVDLVGLGVANQFPNGDFLLYGTKGRTETFLLIRITANGEVIWSQEIRTPRNLQPSSSSNILTNEYGIIGLAPNNSTSHSLLKFTAQGEVEWIKKYYKPFNRYYNYLTSLEGQIYFANQLRSRFTSVIVSTDTNGNLIDCNFQEECYTSNFQTIHIEDYLPALEQVSNQFTSLVPVNTTTIMLETLAICPENEFKSPFFTFPDTICLYSCERPEGLNNLQSGDYEWYLEEELISIFPNPSDLCFDKVGTFELNHIINIGTCPDTFSKNITVVPPIKHDIADTTICTPPPNLFDVTTTGIIDYKWSNGQREPIQLIESSNFYQLTLTDTYCEQSVNFNLRFIRDIYSEDVLSLGEDTTICEQIPYHLSLKYPHSEGYSWGDGVIEESRFIDKEGFYKGTIFLEGCPFSDSIFIETRDCQAKIYVPTVFSPNGDGINDLFFPLGTDFEVLDFKIFNRWGSLVYEIPVAKAWDGLIGQQPAAKGIYTYLFTYIETLTEEVQTITGDVLLMR